MWEDILKKKVDPEYPTQYILLGQTYFLKGQYDKAIRACQKAVRKNAVPQGELFLANSWLGKASICDNEDQEIKNRYIRTAMRHYRKAASLSPHSVICETSERGLDRAVKMLQ